MKKVHRGLLPICASALLLTGCIDDKYDLSDIDTDVRLQVNDLVVPINIQETKLETIFSLKEDSKIKKINGVYAFVEEGEFKSDNISINPIHIKAPTIRPTEVTINGSGQSSSPRRAPQQSFSYNIAGQSTSFTAETGGISDFIISINQAGAHFTLKIHIAIPAFDTLLKQTHIKGLQLRIPRGLTIENASNRYDPKTGIYNFGDVDQNGCGVDLEFKVSNIDIAQANAKFDYATHHIKISDEMAITGGQLQFTTDDLKTSDLSRIPQSFKLVTSFTMSDIDITSYTGEMKYNLEGVNISDVNITGLPDILMNEQTDIRIANPQIYFNVNNPLYQYNLKATAGVSITSYDGGNKVGTYSLDKNFFTIDGKKSEANYYFSPKEVSSFFQGYQNPEWVPYTSLSNVLSGNGIPNRLHIEFVDPKVPQQKVSNLLLGHDFGDVKGHYTFYAPLELGAGSQIIYTDVLDGWSSEDLDAVTIQKLVVRATVTTDIPISIDFTGYPIDKQGKKINNVEIKGATVPANATDHPLEITITGEINGLDGISFEAKALPGSQNPLSPDMNIRLTNIRPMVSGYYEKEL